jgi:diacylglycerol O-acyltransferase / wax synthase
MSARTRPTGPTSDPADGPVRAVRVDRISIDDLMSSVPNRGRTPVEIGAVLMLGVRAGLDPARLLATLTRRLPAVPRLRQRLIHLPVFSGRPIWVDDPQFRVTDHVSVVRCPDPAGEDAVLAVVASLLMTPLPNNRALWAATLVTDAGPGQAALILRVHHVLADGVAGLAILATLADRESDPQRLPFPNPGSGRFQLISDAARDRLRAVRGILVALVHLARALQARTGSPEPPALNVAEPTHGATPTLRHRELRPG